MLASVLNGINDRAGMDHEKKSIKFIGHRGVMHINSL